LPSWHGSCTSQSRCNPINQQEWRVRHVQDLDARCVIAGPARRRLAPAKGVQIYECRASKNAPGSYEWAFVAPEADLMDTSGKRIGRHYAGPVWEAADGSKVQGALQARADAPAANAIPWLLLGTKSVGPNGAFSNVTRIQRLNTSGGVAPGSGCSYAAVGTPARVGYTADYYFFTAR
jgi:hypothetical protein